MLNFIVNAQQIQPPVDTTIPELINQFTGLFQILVVTIFIAVLIGGGFTYLTAGSDDEKVGNAKKIIIYAIVGFIIIALAPAVVNFLLALIGADTNVLG